MGNKLQSAWVTATNILKQQLPGEDSQGAEPGSQRGGTCGLYSLWYASILIRTYRPNAPVIWPRRRSAPTNPDPNSMSLRHYAKHRVGSGQGEILNALEMYSVIESFDYTCDFIIDADKTVREAFIKDALAAEKPVLLPYLEGGNPGVSCLPIAARDNNCGAHWAMLYDETATEYKIVDPHWPNTPRSYAKDLVLAANTCVDDEKFGATFQIGKKIYKLGDVDARTGLKNLLISVA